MREACLSIFLIPTLIIVIRQRMINVHQHLTEHLYQSCNNQCCSRILYIGKPMFYFCISVRLVLLLLLFFALLLEQCYIMFCRDSFRVYKIGLLVLVWIGCTRGKPKKSEKVHLLVPLPCANTGVLQKIYVLSQILKMFKPSEEATRPS